ncbi:phosphopantetheine binding protein [Paractinoplanes brasiliensis]|uniref:Phosphopantetheine binding protein n=2 Tax=Paractinoplanes brasiliensis TaxID=52695 RepID=A0A4V3C8N4_9ACTN|nr:phosphopantetheine binding protein [Actinoplanes brasiliensis]
MDDMLVSGSAPASSQDDLRRWLTARVADYLECPAEGIDPLVPLGEYGLDSVVALAVAGEIEDHLNVTLDSTVLWDHPSIDALARYLHPTD